MDQPGGVAAGDEDVDINEKMLLMLILARNSGAGGQSVAIARRRQVPHLAADMHPRSELDVHRKRPVRHPQDPAGMDDFFLGIKR